MNCWQNLSPSKGFGEKTVSQYLPANNRVVAWVLGAIVLWPAAVTPAEPLPDLADIRYQLSPESGASQTIPMGAEFGTIDWRPAIAVIIDDVGHSYEHGHETLSLPGDVTIAVIPHLKESKRLANEAYAMGKEVMLHLPMQATADEKPTGGLRVGMSEAEIRLRVKKFLDAVPHVSGVNNHQGGFFTQYAEPMTWAMHEFQQRGGLYFVDSRTNPGTVGQQLAIEHRIPSARRDVFLDSTPRNTVFVEKQFDTLLELARARGDAIGIGHPHAETLAVLNRRLARVTQEGVQLLSVSELLDLKVRRQVWKASLSRLRTGVKNSKPSLLSISSDAPVSK